MKELRNRDVWNFTFIFVAVFGLLLLELGIIYTLAFLTIIAVVALTVVHLHNKCYNCNNVEIFPTKINGDTFCKKCSNRGTKEDIS